MGDTFVNCKMLAPQADPNPEARGAQLIWRGVPGRLPFNKLFNKSPFSKLPIDHFNKSESVHNYDRCICQLQNAGAAQTEPNPWPRGAQRNRRRVPGRPPFNKLFNKLSFNKLWATSTNQAVQNMRGIINGCKKVCHDYATSADCVRRRLGSRPQ